MKIQPNLVINTHTHTQIFNHLSMFWLQMKSEYTNLVILIFSSWNSSENNLSIAKDLQFSLHSGSFKTEEWRIISCLPQWLSSSTKPFLLALQPQSIQALSTNLSKVNLIGFELSTCITCTWFYYIEEEGQMIEHNGVSHPTTICKCIILKCLECNHLCTSLVTQMKWFNDCRNTMCIVTNNNVQGFALSGPQLKLV